jgi:biopolymer transport protein ExbB
MLPWTWDHFSTLMQRGGPVMWPLLALSVLAVTLGAERVWFFLRTNHPGRLERASQMASLLRKGDDETARRMAAVDASVYGDVVLRVTAEASTEAAIMDAVESQRRRLERFMPTLSTIITAAPMLGILGTVLGIISSFEILSHQTATTDPHSVSQGIAEALITTAAGLVIALVTLFPYNALRAQIDRTISRIELLAAARVAGRGAENATAEI